MLQIKYILCLLLLGVTCAANAQQTDRDYTRKGNKAFHEKAYAKAEVQYRKALEKNPSSTEANFNLGNALLFQKKAQAAMKQYQAAAKTTRTKAKLARVYHNAGVIFESAKQYAEAINAYRLSLRNNPHDDETRYNLALCQKLLKNQPKNDKNNKNKNKNKQNKKKDKDKDKDKNQQNKNQNQNKDKNQQKNQSQKDKMSKENAEQLLNAAMQDEKNVQQKMRKVQSGSNKLEKNW